MAFTNNDGISFSIPSDDNINKADFGIEDDLNGLIYKDKKTGAYRPKVCSLCNCLIRYDQERAVDIADFKRESIACSRVQRSR